MKMTKQQALKEFREMWKASHYSRDDKIAKREMWHNFTDALHKDGHITQHQLDTWSVPF